MDAELHVSPEPAYGGYTPAHDAALVRQPACTDWPARVLVAVDGSASAVAALGMADALSRRGNVTVELATVYSPRVPPPIVADRRGWQACEDRDRGEAAEQLRAVRRQTGRASVAHRDWPLRLEIGDPAGVMVRLARESAADLVLTGIGHADPAERRWGSRLAIAASRYLSVPLWAAAPRCDPVERCVVVLPDGRVHEPTIRAAVAVLAPGGRLWLAVPAAIGHAPAVPHEQGAVRELVRRACGPAAAPRLEGLRIERAELQGETLAGVLELARDRDAQLIAVHHMGAPGPVRGFAPNLAEPLLASARCSVLVVPDARPLPTAVLPATG